MQRGINMCGIGTGPKDGYPVISTAPVPPPSPPAPKPSPSPAPPGRHHYGTAPCLPDEHQANYSASRSVCAALCDTPEACDTGCPAPESGTSKPYCLMKERS